MSGKSPKTGIIIPPGIRVVRGMHDDGMAAVKSSQVKSSGCRAVLKTGMMRIGRAGEQRAVALVHSDGME